MSSYTMAEVAKHKKAGDAWLVIRGKVYDVTKFVSEHPGGDIILDGAGRDATDLFDDIGHSAQDMMKEYYIGDLKK